MAAKSNPAADPRNMRRVIAEDPDWNLETVPPLVEVCISYIVNNFHTYPSTIPPTEEPLLDVLIPSHKEKVLLKLPPSVPLNITAPLISDEGYWERCCRSRWELCDISEHGHCWKRMYFEKNAQEAIEKFVPDQSSLSELQELLGLSSDFIRCLVIRQLLPPPHDKVLTLDDEDIEGMTDDMSIKVCNDHLDCSVILKNLTQLEELQLTYGVRDCGMNFMWSLFEFTHADCSMLGKALGATPKLKVLRLRETKVNNERGRLLISHLLDHPSLSTLDLSHNCLGDGAGRAIGKLLNDHSPKLTVLQISNNLLEEAAGTSIGHALQRNTVLKELDISMNRLGDLGAQPILKSLMKNATLTSLNMSSNNVGEPSAPTMAEMLMVNTHLVRFNITCNKLGEAGGKLVQEGMEDNHSLMDFDLRLTGISQESEYCINQMIKNNKNKAKNASPKSTLSQ